MISLLKTGLCSSKVAAAIAAATFGLFVGQNAFAGQTEGQEHVIEIKNFEYNSHRITVRAGDTITWINRDIVPHTATAKDKSWDTGTLKTGQSKSIVIGQSLDILYICRFHPEMRADIVFEGRSGTKGKN